MGRRTHLREERDVLHDVHVLGEILRDETAGGPVLCLPLRPPLGGQRRRRRRRREVARRVGVDVVAVTELAVGVARQPQRPEREEGRLPVLRAGLLGGFPLPRGLLLRVKSTGSLGRESLGACVENKLAQPSVSWLSGGFCQRQSMPQAAPGSGRPRPISRLAPRSGSFST